MPIDTREELINALHEACEIEHSLLVQYLYTAFSMKKSVDEGLSNQQQSVVRNWQERILRVAREEMGHLGIVCNLLAAIGAPAKFSRPAIPISTGYYPFPFSLQRFSDDALYRFQIFELPRNHPPPPPPGANLSATKMTMYAHALGAPEPLEYQFIGELYAKIAEGFSGIAEKDLFIGPLAAQTDNNWSDPMLDIQVATDRESALSAIQNIIEDGEGTPHNQAKSHYNIFSEIRLQYFNEHQFEAARATPTNPTTRPNTQTTESVTVIKNATSLRLTELFNSSYGVMLMLLQHYFSLAPLEEKTANTRQELRNASQRIMSVAIRPLAEEVTQSPLDDPNAPQRAGPSFEIYSDISLSPYPEARWTILLESLDNLIGEAKELGITLPRISAIGETLNIMRNDLAIVARGAI